MKLEKGWKILQDVNDNGELNGITRPGFSGEESFLAVISPWEDLERLDFLQLIYADSPYYGRDLRVFNQAPWWYKNEFRLSETEAGKNAVMTFGGIDYYAKVWLNGSFLGQHEGYFAPFSFDVSGKIQEGINTLVIQVSSPNETELLRFVQQGADVSQTLRFLMAEKHMVKGTYEHADTFIQRDVNPVGIWRGVSLAFYEEVCLLDKPQITAVPETGMVTCRSSIYSTKAESVRIQYRITEIGSGKAACEKTVDATLIPGENNISRQFTVENPQLWDIWERGNPCLYRLDAVLVREEAPLFSEKFGFRKIELIRNKQRTQFVLNGENLYLRGTNYFPDVYLSFLTREIYERDVKRMISLGFNAIRVHVHVENPDFYDVCDELGMLVMQDSDLSWFHSPTPQFTASAVSVVSDMIKLLRNHPSIFCWVIMNEPDMWKISAERGEMVLEESMISMMEDIIGPEVTAAVKALDNRPYIKGSMFADDPESGDAHNYTGSLSGEQTHYLDLYGQPLKLTTELGMDLPACKESLQTDGRIYERLREFIEAGGISRVAEYRRRYLKYVMEYHRIQKAADCSGYFQFCFSDLCLQSFYGIYDHLGRPKEDISVFENINKPLGLFMEYRDTPIALWMVNDTLVNYGDVLIQWTILENDKTLLSSQKEIMLSGNACIRVSRLEFSVSPDKRYEVLLSAHHNGKIIAKNQYKDPFHHPVHPKGHPLRVDNELGMRLFDA